MTKSISEINALPVAERCIIVNRGGYEITEVKEQQTIINNAFTAAANKQISNDEYRKIRKQAETVIFVILSHVNLSGEIADETVREFTKNVLTGMRNEIAASALGSIKSPKKAAAARANGSKGGRPRKVKNPPAE